VVERHGLKETLRRQAGPAGEKLLQAAGRLADGLGQLLQRRLVAVVEADLLDDAAHDVVVAAAERHLVVEGDGGRDGARR